MRVFIGNLPGEARLSELEQLLGGIRLHADVQVCKGLDHQERDYHYFIAEAPDQVTGKALIKKFSGLQFHGRSLEARPFVKRDCSKSWQGPERRINPHPG